MARLSSSGVAYTTKMLDLLLGIAAFILETAYELAGAAILDFVLRTIVWPFERSPFENPVLGALAYAGSGAAAGVLSLIPFPAHFVHSPRFHGISLLVAPLLTGLVMSTVGSFLRKKGKVVVRIESFGYGFVFAFGMALVRFLLAK